MQGGYVYILQSTKTLKYYIGSCQNIAVRISEHNAGQTTATRNKGPWTLKFQQYYPSITTARTVECKLKKLKRRDYLEQIIRDGYIRIK
jgi:putative endonuclease